jgi:putative sigma-54 modulation protein
MNIEVKGRNTLLTDDLRQRAEKRFTKIGRQVSDLALLEVEFSEERNSAIVDSKIVECTLHLKGVTLRARTASPEMLRSLNESSEELARQVKRHRDKRRKRRESRAVGKGFSEGASPAL